MLCDISSLKSKRGFVEMSQRFCKRGKIFWER